MSVGCRFDVLVLLVLGCVLCWVLFTEYNLNVPAMIGNLVKRMLDPGPIQRGEPDDHPGRQAVEAALRAVQERMKKQP